MMINESTRDDIFDQFREAFAETLPLEFRPMIERRNARVGNRAFLRYSNLR